MRGHNYEPIDAYLKERFLELLEAGYKPDAAARMLNQTATRYRRLRNPDGIDYDAEFAEQYERVMRPSGPHEEALAEKLEATAIERALDKSDRLLEKALAVYHPAWHAFRPQTFNQTINVEQFKLMLPNVSLETLHQLAEEARQRQLEPPAHPDIEAA